MMSHVAMEMQLCLDAGWTRTRGYLPLRERRERVIAYLRKTQAENASRGAG